MYIDSDDPSA